jgi:signal transduction histidine kinase
LFRNALNATPRGGRIRIGVSTSHDQASTPQASPNAILTVEDNGAGLSEEDRAHLFDPFYSGRQAGRGLGFGLCKCWRIVETHRGRIEIVPRDGGGVRAVVEWPATQAIR